MPTTFPASSTPNVVDGRTWGVPWYVDTRVLFYRQDLLAAAGHPGPPRTWDAAEAAMAAVIDRGRPGAHAILLPLTEWQPLVLLAFAEGATLLADGDCRGAFRSPAFRAALVRYVGMFRRGLAPLGGAATAANVYQDFARGDVAFVITGPWNLGEFARRLPAALADRWTTAPMPAADGPPPGPSLAGGGSLVLVHGTPHADAAWQLIEFLSEPAQQVRLHALTGDLPARRAAWRDPTIAGEPRVAAFRTQLENVRATPKIPEWERIAAKIAQYAEAAIRGQLEIDDALAALDGEVDAILEKRRSLGRCGPGDAAPSVDARPVWWDHPTMIVTLDAKRRLTVPIALAPAKPGDVFEADFDAEEDALVFRRITRDEDWLAVLEDCPVPMDDLPSRRREYFRPKL